MSWPRLVQASVNLFHKDPVSIKSTVMGILTETTLISSGPNAVIRENVTWLIAGRCAIIADTMLEIEIPQVGRTESENAP